MEPTPQESCAPKTHRIIIAQKGNFVVRPGKLNVRRGDTVIWMAIGAKVSIFFPAGIFRPNEWLLGGRVVDVSNGGESPALVIRDDVEYNIYPYSAFCDKSNSFAQGGSDPELIVGP